MFMKRNSGKKLGVCVILTVGALATIGALSITNKGRSLLCAMKTKMTDMMNRCAQSDTQTEN